MIITKLSGGMGNQLFQYALGRSLELKYNIPMYLDKSFLERRDMGLNFTYRDYDLDIFKVSSKFITQREVIDLHNQSPIQLILENNNLPYQEDIHNIFNRIPHMTNIYLDGYWQTDKYFKNIESEIRNEFQLINPISSGESLELINEIKSTNSVMVNIRRTDYLNNDFHGVYGSDYIESAVSIIEDHIDNPFYYIFSDDIKWCSENLNIKNSKIIDHRFKGDRFNHYLELMKSCKHFIIPNSSFAWWAAWLGDYSDKMVIAPEKWFNSGQKTDILSDPNWILL